MPDSKQPNSLDEALAIIESQRAEIDALEREIELLKQRSKLATASRSSTFFPQRFSVRRIMGRAFRAGRTRSRVELLEQSPFFDLEYYTAQLDGRKPFRSVRRAVRHYLSVGAAAGLNPSAVFDTRWYLSKYPDVGSSGHNPLVHFVLYGLEEGRLPGPAGLTGEYLVRKEPTRSQELRLKAWGGFPNLALPALARLADEHLNMQAAWALAGWHYAHGDYEAALYRVGHYEQISREGLSKRALIALAKCYAQLGLREEARLLVSRGRAAGLNNADFPYIAANADILEGNLNKGLFAFNEVYTRVGLCPVGIDVSANSTDSPLSLLGASGVPPVALDQPRVSVIIPAYNAANTLPIALGSLLKQSWGNLEIIVVDDCSQDHTEEIVQAFVKMDARVRYVRNEQNMGAYPSRNRGMAQATGEFVTVHDSDDWSHPQKIERQVHPLLVDPSKVATYSAWVRVTQDMLFVGPWLLSEHFIEKNHSSLLVRAAVLGEVGTWDSVNVAGDTEFLWRLEARYGAETILAVLPTTPLSLALADDNSLTRTKASHVKTIHYGLRRLYREAASWWHRHNSGQAVMAVGERPFPVPLGIVRGTPRLFDEVWVANFSEPGCTNILAELEASIASGFRVCLVHWPDYLGWYKAPVKDEVFEFCSRFGVYFAHHGLEIEASTLVVAGDVPLSYPPAYNVQVSGLKTVRSVLRTGEEAPEWLLNYFGSGGIESPERQD